MTTSEPAVTRRARRATRSRGCSSACLKPAARFAYAAALGALACLLPLSLSAQVAGFEPVRPRIVSARLSGFGGPYAAQEAGFDTLATNPAALAFVRKEWSLSRVAANVSGPLFDLPSVFQSGDATTNILNLVSENNGVYIGLDETGPIAIGKVDRNFGFGIFNRTTARADVPTITKATVFAGEEILLVGGYGLTLFEKGNQSFSAGMQLKGFYQTFLYKSGTSVSVLNEFLNFSTDTIPAVLSTGFGLDAGLLYRLGGFSAGLTCADLYTPVFSTGYANMDDFLSGNGASTPVYDQLSPVLSTGVSWSVPLPETWTTVSLWDVMLDYRDALDLLNPVRRSAWLNVALGTELTLLDVVSLRAGIRDAYLAAGLGLDLSACQIDFAMYGTELGLRPGDRPLLNMALSLSFEY